MCLYMDSDDAFQIKDIWRIEDNYFFGISTTNRKFSWEMN